METNCVIRWIEIAFSDYLLHNGARMEKEDYFPLNLILSFFRNSVVKFSRAKNFFFGL